MKSKLTRTNIALYSPEWYAYRDNFVNASEVGSILGLSQYSCAAKVFGEKLHMVEQFNEDNKFTFWGKKMESLIADSWKYYDGNEDSYIKNQNEGNLIRNCKNINGYVSNPAFPWLSMSLDRVINKGAFNLINREILNEECPLEIKRIHSMELKKWESIPPAYLAQVTTQMIISETKYSEMVLLDSDNNLHVYPIEYNESLAETIIESTKEFWYNRVVPAKKLMEMYKQDMDESVMVEINKLEPPPDDSEAYEQFVKEKYRASNIINSKPGSQDDFSNCIDYVKINKEIKEKEKEKQRYKNLIIHSIGDLERITFEDNYASYSKDKNGSRTLRVSIK